MSATRRWQRPTWFAMGLTLAGVALFLRLGIWQLDRAEQAQRVLDAFEAGTRAPLEDYSSEREKAANNRFPHFRMAGRYLPDRGYLRDEQVRHGVLGVEAYAVLELDARFTGKAGELMLVDRGWIAKPATAGARIALPALPQGDVEVDGILAPFPGSGLRIGGNALAAQGAWPKLTLAIDKDEIAADLGHPLWPNVMLLDADATSGFERRWSPNAMPPERHRAYATQWFAFALAALVIFIALHFKKVER